VVRLRAAFALAAIALVGAARGDVISHYVGGGRMTSPDGRWAISSRTPPDTPLATAWLSRSGKPVRRLMTFERWIEAIWLADGRYVIVRSGTIHFQALHVFRLGAADSVSPDSIQRTVSAQMQTTGPRFGSLENRIVVFGSDGKAPCILVEDWGMPPGRTSGSFIVRRATFALDVEAGRAKPARSCPGAKIE